MYNQKSHLVGWNIVCLPVQYVAFWHGMGFIHVIGVVGLPGRYLVLMVLVFGSIDGMGGTPSVGFSNLILVMVPKLNFGMICGVVIIH